MSSRRIKLVVAYDGTDFCGWAAQPGRRTVQRTLKEAVRQVSGEDVEIEGAGRTDSGAHALGQVCHFDTSRAIPTAKWPSVLGRLLPPDVAVRSATEVSSAFHSRFWATSRWYRYRIAVGERDPFRARFAHWYGRALRVERMHAAGQALVGEHDFLAFGEELEAGVPTRRRVLRIDVGQARDEVRIDVEANAFLRGMMRRIAGGLLEVGRGKRSGGEIAALLTEEREGAQWPVVLPANGLTLMRVSYASKKDRIDKYIEDDET